MNRLLHRGVLIVGALIASLTLGIIVLPEHDGDDCHVFELHYECDLSGWINLIYGDLLIGIALAVVFYYLTSGSNRRIEKATLKSDQILSEIKRVHDRREAYVIQALKNNFSSLLWCIEIINRFSDSDDERKKAMGESKTKDLDRILQKGQSILDLSIDVLDPMVIEKIDKLFASITDGTLDYPKDGKISDFDKIKSNIKEITAKLDEHENSGKVLK